MDILKNKPLLIVIAIAVVVVFLMIFGVVALAAMFYLGASTEKPPETCSMPVGVDCSSAYLDGNTNTLSLILENSLPKKIVVTGAACTKSFNDYAESEETVMGVGEKHAFYLKCTDASGTPLSFEKDDRFTGRINIMYYFQEEGPDHKRRISGNLYAVAK